jgi:hypothetical protein
MLENTVLFFPLSAATTPRNFQKLVELILEFATSIIFVADVCVLSLHV